MGGGGGGGGGVSSASISDVLAAAEARLKRMAQEATSILFVCDPADRANLDLRLPEVSQLVHVDVVTTPNELSRAITGASWVVVFTGGAANMQLLDQAVDMCVLMNKSGVHLKGSPSARIPSKVTVYRWRSITWDELLAWLRPGP